MSSLGIRPEVSIFPQGCKTSPNNSKISVELNHASYDNIAVVKSFMIIPEMVQK